MYHILVRTNLTQARILVHSGEYPMTASFGSFRLLGIAAVCSFAVGAWIAFATTWSSAASSEAPPASIESGSEIVVALIASRACGAAARPGFTNAVQQMHALVAAQRTDSVRISTLGVALDWDASIGLDFLREHGEFEQVAAGGNWLNLGATQLIWRELPGLPAIPQIVVFRRDIEVNEAGLSLTPDQLLFRRVGVQEIIEWVARGAPLPITQVPRGTSP
jgi:hypothetical protein